MRQQSSWAWGVIFCLLLLVLAEAGYPFNGQDVQRLKTTNRCRNCDLAGADLRNGNFAGADLIGANLTGARLLDSSLNTARLNNARLSNAVWTDGRACSSDSLGTCK